ncbi:glycosyltransferase [Actinophytocola xanthii]|uniref:Glycosyl transferase n=1 Tax=Actinophytocola xanthii TaxID=1912961 RepID=A0A1Q8CM91_9PSEU|nr:glycosyltransferase [Actinophytocola xanthii]OLF15461.1 glycosyl transferase [Actinophytocola xanthii]
MRLLFSARPAHGHLHPLLPLALAARAAGHEVTFATGAAFLPRLRQEGFEVHEAGIGVAEAEAEARRRCGDGADPIELILTMFTDVLPRRTSTDLDPVLADRRPDLVVYEQSDVGAVAAARRAGVPAVSHIIGRSLPDPVRARAAERLAWVWEGETPHDPLAGDRCLDIWPPSLRDPSTHAIPTRIPVRPTPWSGAAPLPEIATAPRERPLVYLTLGTVAFGAVETLRTAVEGLSRLPVDVLVATGPGDPAALGEVPASVQVEGFVDQARLLPHVDLVVHHGGTGTLLGAFAAGLPQLLLPRGADQFVNAEVVAELGAGRRLVGPEVTAEAVTEQARALLADATAAETATRVAAEIAEMPAPADVVPALIELAGTRPEPSSPL